ncbi:MAG: dephospho-CoA kinase [Nitrospirae bacterium]|nr:dephospho-CoA kinase [Candidatus Troglogloeales bacterium]MBI3598806.1 dephospho-CoA kinase [Candidatus Troglogloeales bacterium]
MVYVGLTGGIASGKSTVSRIFKEAGAFIVDADAIAHDLLCKKESVYRSVLNTFGAHILGEEGQIDRNKLGEIVFQDAKKLTALNQIVHPFVLEAMEQEGEMIVAQDPHAVIVFDVPLLIETRTHQKVDIVMLVYVDKETQINRLCARDGLSRESAEIRLKLQMALDEKHAYANEIIDNRKSFQEVRDDVMRIYEMLRATGH